MNSGFDTFTDHVVRSQAHACPHNTGSKVGFPIRKSSDQSSFAAPQGLSQRTTSFIASQRQGIHRMLLRHLIALMIDVRHKALSRTPRQDHQSEKTMPSDLSDSICLPIPSDPTAMKPSLATGTRTPQLSDRIPLHDFKHRTTIKIAGEALRHRTTPGQSRWWSQTGSNRRPHACKARALPTELWPQSGMRQP